MWKECEECGTRFEPKRSTARYCGGTCRTRAQRKRSSLPAPAPAPAVPPVAGPAAGPAVPPAGEDMLTAAITAELEAGGRLDTVLGRQALVLASRLRMVSPDTASGLAAVSKELRVVMDLALAGVSAPADPVDELERRRATKLIG